MPDYLFCFLRNLYVGQEAKVRTLYMEQWTGSKLGKEYDKAVYCHCLFHFYAEYVMQNVRLDESQDGIKFAGRNSNNFRYAADTTNSRK